MAARISIEAQHVDDGVLDLVRRDADRPVLDVAMRLVRHQRVDAQGVALELARQGRDVARDGGREQQRAALRRRRVEDEFEVLAEAEVEHLVGLVEDHGAQLRGVETSALQVVAQAAGRADDDVAAIGERALLAAHVHAADAGGDARAGRAVEPDQLAVDLQRQFAGRRDDQRQGLRRGSKRSASPSSVEARARP